MMLYSILKEKEFYKKIQFIEQNQKILENLLQKQDSSFTNDRYQEFIQQDKQEVILSLQKLEKLIEHECSIFQKTTEGLPSFFQETLSQSIERLKDKLLEKWQEENEKKEQNLYKKILQSQKQSLMQILENWEEKQKEKQKDFSLLCNNIAQFIPFLKFLRKKQEESLQETIKLQGILDLLQKSMEPLLKECNSWKQEPLARRKDLDKKKFTIFMDYDEYKRLESGQKAKPTHVARPKDTLIEVDSEEDKTSQEENLETEKETKEKALLSKIHKQKMHFVGANIQDLVLRKVHEILIEKRKILRSEFLSELMKRLKEHASENEISKTKINGIVNIIQAARCFDISKNSEDSKALLSLSERYEDYGELRKAHDMVLYRLGKNAELSFSAEEWAIFLYGNPQKASEIEKILTSMPS